MHAVSFERFLHIVQLVEHAAHHPDVVLVVVVQALADLGRHIVGGAERSMSQFFSLVEFLSRAKISEFDQASLSEEDVMYFDIPMENAGVMEVLNCQCDLCEPVDDLGIFE